MKPIPDFADEAEERAFWEANDSTDDLDWGKARPARLPNLKPTTKTISLRLPIALLDSIRRSVRRGGYGARRERA
jgi:hypothetical protein